MPIYEYHCQSCGYELEEMQKFSDPPLVVCPKCGESSLHKKISATGFQLKGTGWYATDFKDKKPVPKSEESNNSTAKNDAEAGTKTEAKTETTVVKNSEKKDGGKET